MKLRGRKSITFRLTLLFASASTAILLLLGYLIGGSVDRHFEILDMEVLADKLSLIQRTVEKVASPADLDTLPRRLDEALIGQVGLAVAVVAPDGKILYATQGAGFPQVLLDRQKQMGAGGAEHSIVWESMEQQPLRGISALVTTGMAGAPPAIVAVATDISMHGHFNMAFRETLWSFVVLATLATGVLGAVAARRGLAPLQEIKRKAADITAHRLHTRIPVDSVPVELVDLVETLNEMLTRLETSFSQLSDFSSDIAHELRTPVSNLLIQTQVTLSRARSPEEYRDVLASNIEEFEHLSRMISDMLFLAKSDNQLLVPHPEQLNLIDEVKGVLEFYGALAEEKSIALRCSGTGVVSGDRLMLRRAISNLISNALCYTPTGACVSVHVDDSTESLVKLSVSNPGKAIPAEHLPRLFDRFYRADASRQRFTEGVGLGLAITRAIMRAHGGDASVRSDPAGTVFELTIPVNRSSNFRFG
ncbi:two-component sensor histidine kinase [Betaproteobacteria bacterium]|nr:two-component sensor histidine kinase [Betaproteobacteria bacterium]